METNNKTINSELKKCAKKIMYETITEQNCEEILNLLQSILENPFNEIYDEPNFCFLLIALDYITINSPVLNLLKNSLKDKFLYFQLLKVEEDEEDEMKNTKQDRWIIKKEIIEDKNGNKQVVQYNYNPLTEEKRELSRYTIDNNYDPGNIEDLFLQLMNEEDDNIIKENEL